MSFKKMSSRFFLILLINFFYYYYHFFRSLTHEDQTTEASISMIVWVLEFIRWVRTSEKISDRFTFTYAYRPIKWLYKFSNKILQIEADNNIMVKFSFANMHKEHNQIKLELNNTITKLNLFIFPSQQWVATRKHILKNHILGLH